MRVYRVKSGDTYINHENDLAVIRDVTVFEYRDEWRETGLLDSRGHKLMVKEPRHPLGFITPRESNGQQDN